MSEILRFALFILVFMSLIGAGHYYAWARLVRDLELAAQPHRILTLLIIGLFVALFVSLFVGRSLPTPLRSGLLLPAFSWLGVLWLLVVTLIVADLLRFSVGSLGALLHSGLDSGLHSGMSADGAERRQLARLFGGVVLLLGGGAAGLSFYTGMQPARVKRVQVTLQRLPTALNGLKIVQLSDVHIGPTLGREFLEQIVRATNALEPDIVAITGDLVDGSVASLGEQCTPLAELKARYGVFFVTGNHEYYSGAVDWCTYLPSLGVRVLRNECVSIGTEQDSFDLIGIDDHHAEQFGHGHGADLARAVQGRDTTRSLVLLAHQPRQAVDADQHGVELQLSGHTHGGQIWPFNYLVKLQQPIVAGLGSVGRTQVYVNSGTGYWGPPMRLGTVPEITELTLLSPTTATS
jgi:predicted MPP superfamily phosphohydrolase